MPKPVMLFQDKETKLRSGDILVYRKLSGFFTFERGNQILLLDLGLSLIFKEQPPGPTTHHLLEGGKNFEIFVRVLAMATGMSIEEIETHPQDNTIIYKFKK